MFQIDMNSPIPIFTQLERQIKKYMVLGVLQPDDQLPSTRNLSLDLGINPNTISKAYQQLEANGYIYTKKGKGCFVGKQSKELIIQDIIKDFEQEVKEMKEYLLDKESLIKIIEKAYEGE